MADIRRSENCKMQTMTCPRREDRWGVKLVLFCAAIALASDCGVAAEPSARRWAPVTERVWRSMGRPCAHALADGTSCLIIGAPRTTSPERLPEGCKKCELVLLTHHHRDSCASAADF